jgi:hypothetical protein
MATKTAGKASSKFKASKSKSKINKPETRNQDGNAASYKNPPQDPYNLGKTAISVAETSGLDTAIQMVKDASLDSQSTIVWNTLMKLAVVEQRFQLSFELFIDVRCS